jgi:Amt family ammonium transporter
MTWHPDGLFFQDGSAGFFGGTVQHMSAGWAALAGAMFLGKKNSKNQILHITICIARNRSIVVLAGLVSTGSVRSKMALQYTHGHSMSAAAGMALGILDKILGQTFSDGELVLVL